MKTIFLTGSTGFIGKQLVQELMKEKVKVLLLVRSKIKAATIFEEMGIFNPEIMEFVEGDLTKKNLALRDEDRRKVLQADIIIHAGGPMDIQLGEKEAVSSFLQGAKYIGEVAKSIHESKGLEQFVHIVGYMSPFDDDNSRISIDVFKEGNEYLKIKNPYERTKFLADLYIRQQAASIGYPLSVINPPTVVGSSKTGSTEQMEGLGLLVSAVRKGFMPVVPGGKKYRLPIIPNDKLAAFITRVSMMEASSIKTYTLVPDKHTDLDIYELLSVMAESMNMKPPTISVPKGLIKLLLKSGGSKLTGTSSESLAFITNREFSNESAKKIVNKGWLEDGSVKNLIPVVVADLDYRLTYQNHQMDKRFERTRVEHTTVYRLKGEGNPFILFHGLLCDGEDLFPLGIRIHEKTGHPVWIVDLPGLGRSPFLREKKLLAPYIHSVKKLLKESASGAYLIGHSFGALTLLEALKENVIRTQDSLILLQPPIKKQVTALDRFPSISKWLLKLATPNKIEQYILKQGLFDHKETIPAGYIKKVAQSFTSPRILHTTVQLNSFLSETMEKNVDTHPNREIHIIWGNKDAVYTPPISLGTMDYVPFGHHFPISHPDETAERIIHHLNKQGLS
ncbi:alpha/beta fold hydrolase [Aneurinibacillus uraniidurans]|uniref:alpha/beta fold hydrolase n=1 Tax=Aneurinibacillus uraniidurans TaxID=2966586 RepID=UPI002349DF35|nr:alpha/beta fold hydrolase [Aneurinibacillus sp. B1]WCN38667.1 alpha/beta fold hydrolase [Aneurinibacillus sp. B1]